MFFAGLCRNSCLSRCNNDYWNSIGCTQLVRIRIFGFFLLVLFLKFRKELLLLTVVFKRKFQRAGVEKDFRGAMYTTFAGSRFGDRNDEDQPTEAATIA